MHTYIYWTEQKNVKGTNINQQNKTERGKNPWMESISNSAKIGTHNSFVYSIQFSYLSIQLKGA